jgi:hypothetical protein
MPTDPERLPAALVAFANAIEIVTARTRYGTGYHAYGYPEAPWHPFVEGQPPHDGVYRGSFISRILCVRLDLQHPSVSAELRERLMRDFPGQVGGDQGFYEYSVDERISQRTNRDRAIASLAAKVS